MKASKTKEQPRPVRHAYDRFRDMILQSPVAMCILKGPTLIVEIANSRMFDLWGKRPEEMMNKPVFEGLPEARHQGLEELVRKVYSSGKPVVESERPVMLRRQQRIETRYIDFVYDAFREEDGSIRGVMAVAIDVTGQVLARRKIEENEEELQNRVKERTADLEEQKALLNSILDASINGVLALDAVKDAAGNVIDFVIIKINEAFKSITGCPEQLVGESYLSYFPNAARDGVYDMYKSALATGMPVRKEVYSTIGNSGSWFDISVVKRHDAGIAVTFANISAQRAAAIKIEEQKNLLDSILKNSPAGITVYKAIRNSAGQPIDFQCILANHASAEFTGIPVEERYRKTILETVPGLEGTSIFRMAVSTIEEGKSFRTEYYHEPAKKWLELAVAKIYEDHLINVFRDITDIKQAQLQLEAQVEELERMNVNLAHFTYAASHDMKEPLRKVLIFGDRLKESAASQLNPEQQHYLDRIDSATKRMNFLIDDLLTYHEVSGKPPVMEWVDLNRLIEQVLEDLDLEIEEKKARITMVSLFRLYGHPRQLQQVFHNLLGNALKYSKPGEAPEIKIDCRKVRGNQTGLRLLAHQLQQTYFMLSISDNGIGFDQEDAARIFNVFERLHNNKVYEGTGLGLPIVRKVVENHKGFVAAEGTLGVGATFKIFFPEDATRPQHKK